MNFFLDLTELLHQMEFFNLIFFLDQMGFLNLAFFLNQIEFLNFILFLDCLHFEFNIYFLGQIDFLNLTEFSCQNKSRLKFSSKLISHHCVMLRILRIFLCVVISNLNDDKAMLLMLACFFHNNVEAL